MTNFVTQFNDAEREANDAVAAIASTARALQRIGLPIADELFVAAAQLQQAHDAMNAAVNEELSRQVKDADRHIAEALMAALSTTNQPK